MQPTSLVLRFIVESSNGLILEKSLVLADLPPDSSYGLTPFYRSPVQMLTQLPHWCTLKSAVARQIPGGSTPHDNEPRNGKPPDAVPSIRSSPHNAASAQAEHRVNSKTHAFERAREFSVDLSRIVPD